MYIQKTAKCKVAQSISKSTKKERSKNIKEALITKKRELRNKGRESLDVSPQALDKTHILELCVVSFWLGLLTVSIIASNPCISNHV